MSVPPRRARIAHPTLGTSSATRESAKGTAVSLFRGHRLSPQSVGVLSALVIFVVVAGVILLYLFPTPLMGTVLLAAFGLSMLLDRVMSRRGL